MKTTISNLISWGSLALKTNQIPSPTKEANRLWEFATGQNRLFGNPKDSIDPKVSARYKKIIKRRSLHEPFCYITGRVKFYNLQLQVNKHTLIPRPETEILVNLVDKYIKTNKKPGQLTIIDVGTGCGAIAISLAHLNPQIKIIASDKYSRTLKTAQNNINSLNLANQIKLVKADLLYPFPDKSVDLIIANLPYVPLKLKNEIESTIKDFEPLHAVFSGPDGLDAITELIKQIPLKCRPKAKIFLEFWPDQKELIEKLVASNIPQAKIDFHQDIAQITRFAEITLS